KLPHIVRSHDIFNSRSDIFPYSIYHKSTYSQIFRSISSAKIFYANSSEMMDYFIQMKKFEDVDFKVHHNGVDTEKFYPSKNQEVLKSKFGADVILLTVGGLIEDYGIHKFIKLFPEILKQYKDTHIVLVGDGYYKKFIHDYAQNHGIIKNVHLLGVKPHQQIPFYINNCDVGIGRITDNKFIRYSISSKCLEFMACGKPFITAPLSKDLIANNDVGIKVKRNHTKKELLNAFITLIEDKDLRKKLGEKGLNKVKAHFEWNQIMREFNNDLQKYIP
ncbi:MAG: glycosyltransferase family 4 protein, partial [Candidatus Heimdallarchaeota archaeon]